MAVLEWNQETCNKLIETVKNSKTRTEGIKAFADTHNISFDVAQKKFYKLLKSRPSLNGELPNGKKSVVLEVLKDGDRVQELIECIRKHGARTKGIAAFAQKYGLTYNGVRDYFYKRVLTPELDRKLPRVNVIKAPNKAKPPVSVEQAIVEQAILEVIKKKGTPLAKEDIQAAADRAGVHYHVALSTWGHIVWSAKEQFKTEPCGSRNCPWFKGDLFMLMGENGMPHDEIAKIAGVDASEVKRLIDICSKFPKEKRTYPLPLDYYSLALQLQGGNSGEWLRRAADSGWSLEDFRDALEGKLVTRDENVLLKEENERLKKEVKGFKDKLDEAQEGASKAQKKADEIEAKWHEALKTMGRKTDQLLKKVEELEKENSELKSMLKTKLDEESGVRAVSLEQVRELYEAVSNLQERLSAARRTNSIMLNALVRKNEQLLRARALL